MYPAVRSTCPGETDPWGQDQRAAHDVSAGGDRCPLLQPRAVVPHSGASPAATQPGTRHLAVHKPVDERHGLLPWVCALLVLRGLDVLGSLVFSTVLC